MTPKLHILSLACLVLAGCAASDGTSPEEQKYRKVEAAASQCAEEVKNQTIELTAEGQSANIRWTTVDYVVPQQHTRTVEYRTSSVVDNGQPGSAWQACMSNKHALVPELKL
ncbi:hypothetical protein M8013_22640 [Enterobacteriaceae bacterium H4N4]|uniref:Lipoprotein n=1 Tax=Silvania confinis TaxID=2926470 RepID=A0A9J6QL05_9ENTR|nr:hypothetical protein [Silvania confinis]MCU6671521.1 hypothetical protein [Silvania confinis]